MTATFDPENLLDTVLGIMQKDDALNAQVTLVDNEKIQQGKELRPALKPFKDSSYYVQTWVDKILSSSPAIFFGIEDVSSTSVGAATAQTIKVFVEVILVDNGLSNDVHRRLMRYTRALKELFEKNFAPSIATSRVEVDSVRPLAFKISQDSDDEAKVGGISLKITVV